MYPEAELYSVRSQFDVNYRIGGRVDNSINFTRLDSIFFLNIKLISSNIKQDI
jgi:hypothetical protein